MTKKSNRRGLAFKIILSVFSVIAVIFAVIFIYNYNMSKDLILQNIEEKALSYTKQVAYRVERVLKAVEKIPHNLAVLIENSDYPTSRFAKIIQLAVEHNVEIYGATVALEPYSVEGNKFFAPYFYRADSALFFTYRGDDVNNYFISDWYQIPKELGKPVWTEPHFDEFEDDNLLCTYSVPFYKYVDGEKVFRGVVAVSISLKWMQQIMESTKVYETGYGLILSKTGRLVTHAFPELVMNESIFSLAEEFELPEMREMGRKMINGEEGILKYEYYNVRTGKKSWNAFAPIKANGWTVFILYPVDEIMADVYHFNKMVMILGVIGAVILLIIVIFISRSITSPLRKLANATNDFAAGNFDVELPDLKSNDEIGELNASFGSMQKELKRMIMQLRVANNELERYNRTLEDKVKERTAELSEKNQQLDKTLKNVTALSSLGQKITATLDLETIFTTVYESVSSMLDASSFLLMLYDEDNNELDCKLSMEKGERLPEFSFDMNDKDRFAVWCIDNKKPVFMNDVDTEYKKYVSKRSKPKAGEYISSIIYYPMMVKNKVIGGISVQSFSKNAYTQMDLDIVATLAAYSAIAIDNASAYKTITKAHGDLQQAQSKLVQAEKMASLGQLTAGIAHEIKNPLNFVNNFAELSLDIANEIDEELEALADKIDEETKSYLDEIITDLKENCKKINEHGKRADSIVKGMLLHSRGKSGEFQKTDINAMLNEYVNLAYHGMRAQDSTFNIKIETDYDQSIQPINIVPQNLSRVFLNIINNACYSANEKKQIQGDKVSPVLRVTSKDLGERIEVRIYDNGKGISKEHIDKIFNPFFTTKPTGKGTGLGLSLSYDIVVQEHKGEIRVESEKGEYAEFIVTIPKNL